MIKSDFFFSMKAKILFRFGIITLVLVMIGGIFAASSMRIKDAQARVTDDTNDRMLLQKAVADHCQWLINFNSAVTYGGKFTESANPKTCEFGRFLYSGEVKNDPEWEAFAQDIEPVHNQVHADAVEILAETDHEREKEIYLDKIRPSLEDLTSKLYDRIEVQNQKVQTDEQNEERLMNFQMAAILSQILILLLLLVNTYFFIRREVIDPISYIREKCGRLAQGNLTLDFTAKCKNSDIRQLGASLNHSILEIKRYVDDIARMMGEMSNHNFDVRAEQSFIGDFKPIEDSINKMIHEISNMLEQMDIAADLVSSGSEQVSAGAQALAQGATEQASSTEGLASSITEISRQINQNAGNSVKASEMARGATAAINSSNEQMQRLMEAMNDIDGRSKEIGNIIKTIEEISFQTNILALNAAVEAARAGAAGKGFAVVADEVRNLAAKSAEAAHNTAELIESSVKAISGGVKLAQTTASDLLQVVDGANETTAVIEEITGATNAQAKAAAQITVGLDEISTVVQMNSATSEESAAASEELSSQAQTLKNLVKQFRFKSAGRREIQNE